MMTRDEARAAARQYIAGGSWLPAGYWVRQPSTLPDRTAAFADVWSALRRAAEAVPVVDHPNSVRRAA